MKIKVQEGESALTAAGPYAQFFRCLATKAPMWRVASVEDTLRSLDERAVSGSVLWETSQGLSPLEREELGRIAKEALRANAQGVEAKDAAVREAQKADLVTTFKAAMKFLDKEMRKIQKDLGDDVPPEQAFSAAYEALQDEIPAFCAVWDKFTLIRGLKEKGWRIRAEREVESKSPFHDKVLELQQRIGPQIGNMEFQSMTEGLRGVLSLHYGTKEKGVNVHFWYAPSESAYEINVEKGGQIVSTFREDNPELLDGLFDTVASEVGERWNKSAANQIAPDEVDNSLPEALGPDRSGWSQMIMQLYHATRDFLHHLVRSMPQKMIIWRDQYSGDVFEHHLRGDVSGVSVQIRGVLDLESDPLLNLECVYTFAGKSRTLKEVYDLPKYDAVSDLVEEIQDYLEECLERELGELEERPATLRDVLQKALPQGF